MADSTAQIDISNLLPPYKTPVRGVLGGDSSYASQQHLQTLRSSEPCCQRNGQGSSYNERDEQLNKAGGKKRKFSQLETPPQTDEQRNSAGVASDAGEEQPFGVACWRELCLNGILFSGELGARVEFFRDSVVLRKETTEHRESHAAEPSAPMGGFNYVQPTSASAFNFDAFRSG